MVSSIMRLVLSRAILCLKYEKRAASKHYRLLLCSLDDYWHNYSKVWFIKNIVVMLEEAFLYSED